VDSRRQLDVMLQLADLRENIRDKPAMYTSNFRWERVRLVVPCADWENRQIVTGGPKIDGLLDQGGDVTLGRKNAGSGRFFTIFGKIQQTRKMAEIGGIYPPGKKWGFRFGNSEK
jgi:hypothetical protein